MDKNKKDKEKIMDISSTQVGEDATKYGEFISSFFKWDTISRQKKTAEKLENITENGKNK